MFLTPISVKPSAPKGPVEFSDIKKDSVTVAWQPPDNDGGAPIKEYLLEVREKSRSSWSKVTKVKAGITSYCVQNLKALQEFVFRVFAENEVGQSDALVSDSVTLNSPHGETADIVVTLVSCAFFLIAF